MTKPKAPEDKLANNKSAAKLDPGQRDDVAHLYLSGRFSTTDIANAYGVDTGTVTCATPSGVARCCRTTTPCPPPCRPSPPPRRRAGSAGAAPPTCPPPRRASSTGGRPEPPARGPGVG